MTTGGRGPSRRSYSLGVVLAVHAVMLTAVLAFFGVIHSPLQSEQIGLPWDILKSMSSKLPPDEGKSEPKAPSAETAAVAALNPIPAAVRYQTPYHWTAAYVLLSTMLMLLSVSTHDGKSTKSEIASHDGEPAA